MIPLADTFITALVAALWCFGGLAVVTRRFATQQGRAVAIITGYRRRRLRWWPLVRNFVVAGLIGVSPWLVWGALIERGVL